LQTRDFVSIDDVVNAINHSISNIKDKQGIVYNIASGKSITINDLANLMISISGKKLETLHYPEKKGEIKFSQADISLAKKELGFFPKLELRNSEFDEFMKYV